MTNTAPPEAIRFQVEQANSDATLLPEAFDSALLGLCERHCSPPIAAYDEEKLKALLGEVYPHTVTDTDQGLAELKESLRGNDNQPAFVRYVGQTFAEITAQVDSVISFDGFEEQVVGIASRESWPDLLIYDGGGCVNSLAQQDMSWEDALEYFDFNVGCAWVGDTTPAFLYTPIVWDDVPPSTLGVMPTRTGVPWCVEESELQGVTFGSEEKNYEDITRMWAAPPIVPQGGLTPWGTQQ